MAAWNGCRHDGCFDGIGNFGVGCLRGDRDAGMDSLMMAATAWNGMDAGIGCCAGMNPA